MLVIGWPSRRRPRQFWILLLAGAVGVWNLDEAILGVTTSPAVALEAAARAKSEWLALPRSRDERFSAQIPRTRGLGPHAGALGERVPRGQRPRQPSLAFTSSLSTRPSARLPPSLALTAVITLPMSLAEDAPVSAIATATSAAISSAPAAAGM